MKVPRKNIIWGTLLIVIFAALLILLVWVFKHYSDRSSSKKELFSAIRNDDYHTVAAIIDKYPSLVNENEHTVGLIAYIFDTSSDTPLLEACQDENDKIIEFLVEHGADINKSSNVVDLYPLLSVIIRGRYDLGWYFIENGADLSVQQRYLTFPFAIVGSFIETDDIESQTARLKLMKYAIEHEVPLDPPEPSFYGMQSVYGMAARHNNTEIVEYFLSEGIFSIDERVDDENRTALMVAVQGKAYGVCELLLRFGANEQLTDHNGKNAYDYAVESGDENLLSLLGKK